MTRLRPLWAWFAVCSIALSPAAVADAAGPEDADQCYLHQEVTVERLLRRLSMDLRGYVPHYEDYALVEGKSTVPDEVIDAFLDSDGFQMSMRRYHELLLWPNPYGIPVIGNNFAIRATNLANTTVWHINSQAKWLAFRGGNGSHLCQDIPQSQLGYEMDGSPVCMPMGDDGTGPYCQEGWVEVAPYWESDPLTTIKVCAFDAQQTTVYTDSDGTHDCNNRYSSTEPSCGCGPDLRFCMQYSQSEQLWASWREQLLQLVDDYTDGSLPYTEMLTTKRAYTNGRLQFFKKYLAPQGGYFLSYNQQHTGDAPLSVDPEWLDTTWVEVTRESPHAGILTLPAYTLRFQTNRGRANRFRIAFAGQYFQPPNVETIDCELEGDDLTERCTCRKCHQVLEPLAAYFGPVAEAGSALLTDFVTEYPTLADCYGSGYDYAYCTRFYIESRDSFDPDIVRWRLAPLQWADDAHPTIAENFDAGPAGIVDWAVGSGLLHRATVTNLFKFLLKRDMNLEPSDPLSEVDLLDELAAEFEGHDNFKLLVKRIVQLPQYRRMP